MLHISKLNWKLILGLIIGGMVLITVLIRLTRNVPSYLPLTDQVQESWGSVDFGAAEALQNYLDENVNQQKVPGLQAYLHIAEGKTWSGSSGTTDLARKTPLLRDDILRVGSVTKTFTAVVIMNLVEEDQLNLDDPLGIWFPEFPTAGKITVRQLLNHTSGIPEIIQKGMMRSVISSTYWEPDELVALIAGDPESFGESGSHQYSNTNYILLGLIAEKVTERSFTELLQQYILNPLNLEHTFFIPYEQTPAGLVPGYERDLARIPGMLDISVRNTSWATLAFSSGALASTAEDLGIFTEALFSGIIVSPASLEEMTVFIDAPNPGIPEQTGYGLGLMQFEVNGKQLIGHIGWFMGSSSIIIYDPLDQIIFAVTCNLSTPDLVQVMAGLREVAEQ